MQMNDTTCMAEKEEGLKSLMMMVKKESENKQTDKKKNGLKLNIQKQRR